MIRNLLPMAALFLSTGFLMAGGGMQNILLPVRGQIDGFSSSQIGLLGAGWAVGFTLGCIIVPRLVRRVGHVRCFSVLASLLATVMLLYGLIVDAGFWIFFRAIAGLCFAGSYMIIESWLNERITNENRGAVFSTYMVISQLAMLGGQYLLVTADPEKETLFMFGAILFALAVLPTALSKAQSPAPLTQVSLDLTGLYTNSPAAAVGAVICGCITGTWTSFAPVFGAETGMSLANIANLVSFAMIGSILFQFPIGRLSDFMDRRYVMIGAALCGASLGFIASQITVNGANPGIAYYALITALGGFIYPLYAVVVAHANDYADNEDFVKTSSSLLILYGVGTMIGPMVTGSVMESYGVNSLFNVIGAAHLCLAIYVGYRVMVQPRPDDMETLDFQAGPIAKPQTPETYALDPRSDSEAYNAENE